MEVERRMEASAAQFAINAGLGEASSSANGGSAEHPKGKGYGPSGGVPHAAFKSPISTSSAGTAGTGTGSRPLVTETAKEAASTVAASTGLAYVGASLGGEVGEDARQRGALPSVFVWTVFLPQPLQIAEGSTSSLR